MRVYVAGASAELERCERVIAALAQGGCTVTHDWTPSIREHIARGISEEQLDDHEARRLSGGDYDAIERAHFVLFLAPETVTRGAWSELGYAGCLMRRGELSVYVSGPRARQSIFTRQSSAIFLSDDDAVSAIARRVVRGPLRVVPA
jgi:hypothetical protein